VFPSQQSSSESGLFAERSTRKDVSHFRRAYVVVICYTDKPVKWKGGSFPLPDALATDAERSLVFAKVATASRKGQKMGKVLHVGSEYHEIDPNSLGSLLEFLKTNSPYCFRFVASTPFSVSVFHLSEVS